MNTDGVFLFYSVTPNWSHYFIQFFLAYSFDEIFDKFDVLSGFREDFLESGILNLKDGIDAVDSSINDLYILHLAVRAAGWDCLGDIPCFYPFLTTAMHSTSYLREGERQWEMVVRAGNGSEKYSL